MVKLIMFEIMGIIGPLAKEVQLKRHTYKNHLFIGAKYQNTTLLSISSLAADASSRRTERTLGNVMNLGHDLSPQGLRNSHTLQVKFDNECKAEKISVLAKLVYAS